MNKKPKSNWSNISAMVIIIVSICAAATFYWIKPVADIEKASPVGWFGAAFIAGIVCGVFSEKHFALTSLLVTLGFALAIIIRVLYDTIFVDPTSHNLFPIEVMIWTIMAAIPAFIGTLVGNQVIRLLVKKITDRGKG
jgi:hypothetical protein